nr:SDR family oxidoreductase [Ponticoccus alexandrii]
MKLDFTGARMLVAAGAGGIGWATTHAFSDAGARMHICDIDEAALARRAQSLTGLETSCTDVSRPEQVEAVFDAITRRFGELDMLVNNAGIARPTKPVGEVTDEEWAATLWVNISGQFYCARGAADEAAGAWRDRQYLVHRRAHGHADAYALFDHEICGARAERRACGRVGRVRDPRQLDSVRAERRAARRKRGGRAGRCGWDHAAGLPVRDAAQYLNALDDPHRRDRLGCAVSGL